MALFVPLYDFLIGSSRGIVLTFITGMVVYNSFYLLMSFIFIELIFIRIRRMIIIKIRRFIWTDVLIIFIWRVMTPSVDILKALFDWLDMFQSDIGINILVKLVRKYFHNSYTLQSLHGCSKASCFSYSVLLWTGFHRTALFSILASHFC